MQNFDYSIASGAILGISIGIEILKIEPSSNVVIIEKESQSGGHASGRNS